MADTDAPTLPEKSGSASKSKTNLANSKRGSKPGTVRQSQVNLVGSKPGSRKASVTQKSGGSKRSSTTQLATPAAETGDNDPPTAPNGEIPPADAPETAPTDPDPSAPSADPAAQGEVLSPEEQEHRAEQATLTRLQTSLTHITALLDAETPLAEVGDEVEVIPAVARTLASPLLSADEIAAQHGYAFVSVDYEVDLDLEPDVASPAGAGAGSAGGTAAGVLGVVPPSQKRFLRGASLEEMATAGVRVRTPMLKPTSPTQTEEEARKAAEAAAGGVVGGEVPGEGAGTVLNADAVQAIVAEGVDREALIESIKNELDLKEKYKIRNTFLQNKLGEYFKRKRTDDAHDGEKSVADQEQRYANCMTALAALRTEYESQNQSDAKIESEYKAKLEERSAEAREKSEEFIKFKRSVALAAENSRTGKNIPPKQVAQLEATDQRKDMEVVAVRLDHIKLRNKLKRHEQLLRQKEELADGLHLIDFEQLKIENQTYNEKIEERNEELLKLRKKITNIVQVLTHVKEKLQFVQAENGSLRRELKGLDGDVAVRRDSLPSSKQARDAIKSLNTMLRQKNGLLGNKPLLRDYEEKVDETDALKQHIDDLRTTHANLSAETLSIKRQIQRKLIV